MEIRWRCTVLELQRYDKMHYAFLMEKIVNDHRAYVPDLPGCVATGDSAEEVMRNITEAILFHLDGLNADGVDIPVHTSSVEFIAP